MAGVKPFGEEVTVSIGNGYHVQNEGLENGQCILDRDVPGIGARDLKLLKIKQDLLEPRMRSSYIEIHSSEKREGEIPNIDRFRDTMEAMLRLQRELEGKKGDTTRENEELRWTREMLKVMGNK